MDLIFTSPLEKLIDRATSESLLEPDWGLNLQLCDAVRAKEVSAKDFLKALRRRIPAKNPNVTLLALTVLETAVKNCGPTVHDEISAKPFLDDLRDIAKSTSQPEKVRSRVLELIQVWAHAFRKEPAYRNITDAYNSLKAEGCSFPALREADAMFASEKAPEWIDSDKCFSCKTPFTVIVRKHHCRNCGQVFCQTCSAKNSTIPRFGFEKEVRVCDSCHDKLQGGRGRSGSDDNSLDALTAANTRNNAASPSSSSQLTSALSSGGSSGGYQTQQQRDTTAASLAAKEDEELRLAIALSLQEAEKTRQLVSTKAAPQQRPSYDLQTVSGSPPASASVVDPALAKYLDRDYWEQRGQSGPPPRSASQSQSQSQPATAPVHKGAEIVEEVKGDDDDRFVQAMSASLAMFEERLKAADGAAATGRPFDEGALRSLYQSLCVMHPRLLRLMEEQEGEAANLHTLERKVEQAELARRALDEARAEHAARLKREAEEQEYIRKMQVQQRLRELQLQEEERRRAQEEQQRIVRQMQLEQERLLEHQRMEQERLRQMQQQQLKSQLYGAPPVQPPTGYQQVPQTTPYPPRPAMGGPQQSPQQSPYYGHAAMQQGPAQPQPNPSHPSQTAPVAAGMVGAPGFQAQGYGYPPSGSAYGPGAPPPSRPGDANQPPQQQQSRASQGSLPPYMSGPYPPAPQQQGPPAGQPQQASHPGYAAHPPTYDTYPSKQQPPMPQPSQSPAPMQQPGQYGPPPTHPQQSHGGPQGGAPDGRQNMFSPPPAMHPGNGHAYAPPAAGPNQQQYPPGPNGNAPHNGYGPNGAAMPSYGANGAPAQGQYGHPVGGYGYGPANNYGPPPSGQQHPQQQQQQSQPVVPEAPLISFD